MACHLDLSPPNLKASPFKSEYKGNAAKDFERFINKCYNEWRTNCDEWHSPYTAIVQSSGYGKTHLCKEFACSQTNWLTVYICYREAGVYGYPTGNKQARKYMTEVAGKMFRTEQDAILLMIEWFHAWRFIRIAFHRHFCQNNLEDYNMCLTEFVKYIDGMSKRSKEDYVEVFDNMQQYCKNVGNTASDLSIKEAVAFWDLCENHNTASTLHTYVEKITSQFQLFDDVVKDKKLKSLDMPVFFAFDEARFLFETNLRSDENYTMFRAACGALKVMTRNVFAVFVDTTPQVSNFVPPLDSDRPSRFVHTDKLVKGTKLFRPYNEIDTMDVLNDDIQVYNENHRVFLYGRPLWKKTYDSFNIHTDDKLEWLKSFAERKLQCGKAENDEIVAIASMAVATDMSIIPKTTIHEKLIGSHMATCLVIEDDRESMLVCYPVEPILSEVVLSLLKKYNKNNTLCKNILQHIISHQRIGTLSRAFNGQLVVKLLLLLARGRASKAFKRCTLKDFLAALTVQQFPLPESEEIDTTKFQLSFTCFTKLMQQGIPFDSMWMHNDPQQVLQAYYDRNAALEFPTNHGGADFLLPLKSVDNGNEFKYILVQVTNVATDDSVICDAQLTPKSVFGEKSKWCKYTLNFSLLINVGGVLPQTKKDPVVFHKEKRIFEIIGLDVYVDLSKETKNDLKKILGDYKEKDEYFLSCNKLQDMVLKSKRLKREEK